jgi:TolB-like protein
MELSLAYEKEIRSISLNLAENISKSGKKTIAVVDFTDLQGNVTELGRFLAEELSGALAEAGKGFEVVDRTHLKSLLKEHQLALTGLIDPNTARKLGEIAGVHALITGTITPFGDSIRLAVKVLDTATAKVIGASRGDIAKTKAIEELLAKGIQTVPVITQEPSAPTPSPTKKLALKRERAFDIGKFVIEVESLKVLADGSLMVALAYVNQTKEELEINLDYPRRKMAFASDDAGNEYTLAKSSGMQRGSNPDPNYDLRRPGSTHYGTISFLLCSPGQRARGSFLFKGTSLKRMKKSVKKSETFTISLSHYARPTKDFDPDNPKGAFNFSATISNVQPD